MDIKHQIEEVSINQLPLYNGDRKEVEGRGINGIIKIVSAEGRR